MPRLTWANHLGAARSNEDKKDEFKWLFSRWPWAPLCGQHAMVRKSEFGFYFGSPLARQLSIQVQVDARLV